MSTLKVDNIRHNNATSDAITMASDGTCTARITGMTGGGGLSHRNKVINGAMNICQRATTQNTISSSGYYVADRFHINMVNVGSFRTNLFQSSQSPDGFNNSLGVSIGSGTAGAIAASERVSLEQRIESQDLQDLSFGTSAAKSFTLSFYVRSTRTGQYGINMRQHDSGKDYNEKFDISVANTWERKIITVTGNTGDTFADDNGIGMWFRIMLRAGSDSVGNVNYQSWGSSNADKAPSGQQTTWGTSASDDFYLTGVQLEVGDTATSFEHRSLGDELARCQRYCVQYNSNNVSRDYIMPAKVSDADDGYTTWQPPVAPRTTIPTISVSNASHLSLEYGDFSYSSPVNFSNARDNTAANPYSPIVFLNFDINENVLSSGQMVFLCFTNNTTGGYLRFEWEL